MDHGGICGKQSRIAAEERKKGGDERKRREGEYIFLSFFFLSFFPSLVKLQELEDRRRT